MTMINLKHYLKIVVAVFFLVGFYFPAWAADPSKVMVQDPKNTAVQIKDFPKISLPDLTIESLQFSPVNPKPGDTATFSFVIKNIGNGVADPSHAAIYSLPVPFDVHGVTTIPLAPGQGQTFSFSAQLNDKSPGSYLLGVDLNLKKQPLESNYNNNYKTINLVVSPSTANLPDLVISSYKIEPPSPSRNGPATITVEVKNVGPKPSGPTRLSFAGYPAILSLFGLSTTSVPALGPNQSRVFTFTRLNLTVLLEPRS
jgi:hypothetical protein